MNQIVMQKGATRIGKLLTGALAAAGMRVIGSSAKSLFSSSPRSKSPEKFRRSGRPYISDWKHDPERLARALEKRVRRMEINKYRLFKINENKDRLAYIAIHGFI